MKITLLSVLIFFSFYCFSCSCIGLGKIDKKQYDSYDLIAKGQIIKIPDEENGFYMKIESLYKGEVKSDTVRVFSSNDEAMCGISFKIGEYWLIYAYEKRKKFSTGLCTRTKNLDPNSWRYNEKEISEEIRFLSRRK
jgi:hypothetical protein